MSKPLLKNRGYFGFNRNEAVTLGHAFSLDVAPSGTPRHLLSNPLEADSLSTSLLHEERATCFSGPVCEFGGDCEAGCGCFKSALLLSPVSATDKGSYRSPAGGSVSPACQRDVVGKAVDGVWALTLIGTSLVTSLSGSKFSGP
ncbi:hypothetical protein Cadr_000007435 [Camelus dromedarius]|uniref:Uncharacterized protein n=1 Tax=Camelus dromedarius TaxID=9838 RepID=A0A5N4E8I6_CAMDR|nr:hypothetical protein Cadr_000007435 [Camelus dromedarius]